MKTQWTWDHVRKDDRPTQAVVEQFPGLRFGDTGLTIIYEIGRYSVTHDVSGKSLGFKTSKITLAKRYAAEVAPWLDWHVATTDEMKAARPTIAADLRQLASRFAFR